VPPRGLPWSVPRAAAGHRRALGRLVHVERRVLTALRHARPSAPGSAHRLPHAEQLPPGDGTRRPGRRDAHRRVDLRHRADDPRDGRRRGPTRHGRRAPAALGVRSGARNRSLVLEVLRSSAFLVGTELATRAVSLLTTLYLARTLARDGVRLVESRPAPLLVLQGVSGGGVDALFTSEATRHRGDVPRIAGRALLISWLLLAVVMLGLGT